MSLVRRPRARRGRAVRALGWTALALVLAGVLAVGSVVYVGWRVQQAADHLRAAAARVPALTAQLTALDVERARATRAAMRAETAAAVALTDDPVWRLLERFPWGGQNLLAAEAGARAAHRLSTQGAGGAVEAADGVVALRERALSLDLSPSGARADAARARDGAAALLAATTAARGELSGLDRRYLLPPAASALRQADRATAALEALQGAADDPLGALLNAP